MNRGFRLLGFAVVGIALGTAVLLLFAPPMMNDFVEYWAAGRLNLAGENPYDPVLMLELERSVGFAGDRALMMLNPPPALTLVMPLGALPYRQASVLWFVLHTAVLLWSCALLWNLAGGPRRMRWVAYLCGVIFVPTLFALFLGQISILLLLGLVLFLRFVRDGRMTAAGLRPRCCWSSLMSFTSWEPLSQRGGSGHGIGASSRAWHLGASASSSHWHSTRRFTPSTSSSARSSR
jgi:hypothetical protein